MLSETEVRALSRIVFEDEDIIPDGVGGDFAKLDASTRFWEGVGRGLVEDGEVFTHMTMIDAKLFMGDDEGESSYDFFLQSRDHAVHLVISYPPFRDDECDGFLSQISVYPAPEFQRLVDQRLKAVAEQAISNIIYPAGNRERGLEIVMDAVSTCLDKTASPSLSS